MVNCGVDQEEINREDGLKSRGGILFFSFLFFCFFFWNHHQAHKNYGTLCIDIFCVHFCFYLFFFNSLFDCFVLSFLCFIFSVNFLTHRQHVFIKKAIPYRVCPTDHCFVLGHISNYCFFCSIWGFCSQRIYSLFSFFWGEGGSQNPFRTL